MFHSLAIAMTNKCNAACEMCCFSCSPDKNTLLDEETVKNCLRQARDLNIQIVGFTGGEVMLFYNQLLNCVAYAESIGIITAISTNGFWAQSPAKGYNMIKTLVDAGLKGVSFSVDKYHQAFVPYETVAQAIQICEQLGVLRTISLIGTKDDSSVHESIERLELHNKNYKIYPLLPAGGAAKSIPDNQIIRECKAEHALCAFNRTLSVLYDGTINLCCSQFAHEIDMTKVGQLGLNSLEDAVTASRNNDFFYVLMKKQFKWYIELAKIYGLSVREKYSASCELCHELFSNKDFVNYVLPYVQQEAIRLRLASIYD